MPYKEDMLPTISLRQIIWVSMEWPNFSWKTKNERKEPSKQTLDRNVGYINKLQDMNMES